MQLFKLLQDINCTMLDKCNAYLDNALHFSICPVAIKNKKKWTMEKEPSTKKGQWTMIPRKCPYYHKPRLFRFQWSSE